MDTVWWTKVINANRFLDIIVDTVQNGQSVILHLPKSIPWYMEMRNIVETELIRQNSISTYKYIEDSIDNPGEYLFREFCKKEKRAHYRPGIGYAEFLAKSEDIVLNDCILWISEVDSQQLAKWILFIESYNRVLGKYKKGCIFLVETRDVITKKQNKKGITDINYVKEIERYDNYLFNMLMVSNLSEKEIFKQYLAETVSIMLPDDIELSSCCITYGRDFLEAPLKVIKDIVESESRSNGDRFEIKTSEAELQKRLWEAQIKTIFPLIEKYKNILIQKYQREIEALLPISTAYGEVFQEVSDVELGTLSYLVGSRKILMLSEDVDRVLKLKNARNILAHVRTLSQEGIDEIFAL